MSSHHHEMDVNMDNGIIESIVFMEQVRKFLPAAHDGRKGALPAAMSWCIAHQQRIASTGDLFFPTATLSLARGPKRGELCALFLLP
jgi:hypothetical protein